MQRSTSKSLRSLWLASAGLAPALALLLLGASTARVAAYDFNFNGQNDTTWTRYDLGDPALTFGAYPTNIYSFPTNTAGPAGNYAYRIQIPVYASDPWFFLYPRGGSFQTNAVIGGTNDANAGRFSVGADLVAWRTDWPDMEIGLAWYGNVVSLANANAYLMGWGPGQKTLGIASIVNTTPGLIGLVAQGSTPLQTGHQYRFVASSYDGVTYLAQVFDLAQPNNPWQSAITRDTSLSSQGGYCGMMGAVLGQIPTGQGADATWDNFHMEMPAGDTEPYTLPATVTDLSPPPAGQVTEFYPTVKVEIMNRDSNVRTNNPNWIKLYLDGVQIPNNQLTIDPVYVWKVHNNDESGGQYAGPQAPYPTNFPGATITYPITNLLARGWHTNIVVFEDDQEKSANPGNFYLHTNTWSWNLAYPIPFATNGSLSVKGFDARLVMSYNTNSPLYANIGQDNNSNMGNSVAAATTLLTIPCPYLVNFAATNKVDLVNFDRNIETFNGNPVTNFPGMCLPAADPAYVNSYAVEVLAYLQLAAGTNTFYVDSDDGVAVYTGNSLTDSSIVLMSNNGVAHQAFNWVVIQDGLYPVRIIMEEGGGGAYLILSSVTAGTTNLVNAAGGVNAYYPLVCLSSTSVKGPFTVDAVANAGNVLTTASSLCESGTGPISNLTVTGGTITVPLSSTPKFYRLDGPRKTKITSCKKSGTDLRIEYQAY